MNDSVTSSARSRASASAAASSLMRRLLAREVGRGEFDPPAQDGEMAISTHIRRRLHRGVARKIRRRQYLQSVEPTLRLGTPGGLDGFGGNLIRIHSGESGYTWQQSAPRALAGEFRASLRQRHVSKCLHVAAVLGEQIGEQLRVTHRLALPARRARFARLVVENGVAPSFDEVDAIDPYSELAAGDADLTARLDHFHHERCARALELQQLPDERFEAQLFPLQRGSQVDRYIAAKYRDRGGLDGVADDDAQDPIVG